MQLPQQRLPLVVFQKFKRPLEFWSALGFVVDVIAPNTWVVAGPRHILLRSDIAEFTIFSPQRPNKPLTVVFTPWYAPSQHDLFFTIVTGDDLPEVDLLVYEHARVRSWPRLSYASWHDNAGHLDIRSATSVTVVLQMLSWDWSTVRARISPPAPLPEDGMHLVLYRIAARPGFSGSPVWTEDGKIVGMLVGGIKREGTETGKATIVHALDIRKSYALMRQYPILLQ